ncbi:hypothetical protein ETU10_08510 [Apibacter muscae]|uniref:hypothetical protein n=1 Tax=Apibacter muscae TaxID=2509004 RepID=UPI0011AD4154|nr:hypothetical protein [Apibacter muscae]TWP23128.1 hypothetical protein ETU10_08510 [Apibacter muscae]
MVIKGIENEELVKVNSPKILSITTDNNTKNMQIAYSVNGQMYSNIIYPIEKNYNAEIQAWLKLAFYPFVFDLSNYTSKELTSIPNVHFAEATVSFVARDFNNIAIENTSINLSLLDDIVWDKFIIDDVVKKVYWDGMGFVYSWLSEDLKTRFITDNIDLIKLYNPTIEIKKIPTHSCSGYYLTWYGLNTDYYFWYFRSFEESYSVDEIGRIDLFTSSDSDKTIDFEDPNQSTLGMDQQKNITLTTTLEGEYFDLFITLFQSPNVFVQKVEKGIKYKWERVFIKDQDFAFTSQYKTKEVQVKLSFDKQYTVRN